MAAFEVNVPSARSDPTRNKHKDHVVPAGYGIGSFSKPLRRRRRGRNQTKGVMSRTMAAHTRYNSLYISLPSSAKQQREMTKFYVFWTTRTAMANFLYLRLKSRAVGAC